MGPSLKTRGLTGNTALFDMALLYVSIGLPVLPTHGMVQGTCSCGKHNCRHPGKHPRIRNWPNAASTDPELVAEWWRRWPEANIATVPKGFIVLDVDRRNDGLSTLSELERKNTALPETVVVASGGGGQHLWFREPDTDIRTGAHAMGPGIDVLGKGKCVLLPPSRHQSGKVYVWRTFYDLQKLAELPSWVLGLLQQEKAPRADDASPTPSTASLHAHARSLLDRALARAKPGNRNDVGFWLACQLRDEQVSMDSARATMMVYADTVQAGGHAYTVGEAIASLKSAFERAPRQPSAFARIFGAELIVRYGDRRAPR